MAGFNPIHAALTQAMSKAPAMPHVSTTAPKLSLGSLGPAPKTPRPVSLRKLSMLGGGSYNLKGFGL